MRIPFGRRTIVVTAIAVVMLAAFWVYRSSLVQQSLMFNKLRQENEALRAELEMARQREVQREQTLKHTSRSADEFLALFPAKFPSGDWQPSETTFEDCWFTASDGLRLHAWYLRHPQPRAAVLHLHGNAGNLTHRADTAEFLFQQFNVSVLIFDYRGYGRSEGIPTMLGLLRDARAARTLLAEREQLAEDQIVLLGESLGGAVAVDLAAEDGARGLILENTFSSLRDVAGAHYPKFLVSMLVADKLNSAAKIKQYRGPLLQVHGDADTVVPLESGRKLHAVANEPKSLIVLPGHDHNDQLPKSYYTELDAFLQRLPATSPKR